MIVSSSSVPHVVSQPIQLQIDTLKNVVNFIFSNQLNIMSRTATYL
jgi:hypothetical protein